MDFSLLLGVVSAAFLCFVLRALPRIGKSLVGHDTWYVLLAIDELKKGHSFDDICEYFLIKGDHDYPPLFFYFLSILPSSWLRKFNWMINPLLDSVNSVLLFGGTYLLSQNVLTALVAAGIYSLTPAPLDESLNFNTRIFGLLLFNLAVASLVLYYYFGGLVFMVCAVLFGIAVLLSHKFATQVLYPLLIFFAALIRSYVPLLVLSGIVIGAIVVSGGFYLRILRGHIGITRFWLKHYKEYGSDYLGACDSTCVSNTPKDVEEQKSGLSASVRVLWRRTRRMNPLYWLLEISPFNPFALIPVIMLAYTSLEMSWQWIVYGWSILTMVFFYLATYLRFLGHYPGRKQFMDYNAFPTAYLCSLFVLESPSLLKLATISVILLLSIVQSVRSWLRIRVYNRSDDQSLLEHVFEYLRTSNKDGVLCLPASHTYAIPYFSGKKVFYTVSARNYEKIGSFFPVLRVPLGVLIEDYDIHFVLVDTTIVPVNRIDLSGFRQVMEENSYALYERFK